MVSSSSVTHSSVIQELIPQLAVSLGQLRRAPGKGDAWVGQIILALEKERDPRFERMRRRIGFAQRLGAMAEMAPEDIALSTLAIFFHELLPLKRNGARGSRPWREYLLRNEDWLRPALEICEAVRAKNWEEMDDSVEIVAKIAVVYDNQTLERHERPLVVVEAIMTAVEAKEAQRIVDLLWTEEGQALCDHHFRRHPRGYKLDPKEIRSILAHLYRFTPRISTEVQVQSMRSGGIAQAVQQEMEVEQALSQTKNENGALDNFDRRRAALRTRKSDAEPIRLAAEAFEQDEQDERENAEAPSNIETKLREMERAELPREQESQEDAHKALDSELDEADDHREDRMNQLATISPTNHARGDALDARDRLQELAMQLGQIQRIAAQAEVLLADIAPQIDDFAARIADVEAVMERWSGRSRVAA